MPPDNMSTAADGFRLIYTLEGQPCEVVLTERRVTLGRAPDCTVVFPPDTAGVSRHHATISREGGEWFISDEGSRNGTYVDQAYVTKSRLNDGARINLGNLELTFRLATLRPGTEGEHLPSTASLGTAGGARPGAGPHEGPPRHGDRPGTTPFAGHRPDSSPVGPARATRVEFDDAPVPDVSMSINLAYLQDRIGGGSSMRIREPFPGQPTAALPPEAERPAAGDETARQAGAPPPERLPDESYRMIEDRSWGINLFSEVGHALLASTDLDVMLKNILNLVFSNVPAERGLMCLYEEETGELTPRCVRASEEGPQPSLRISKSIANKAIQDKTSLLVTDTAADSRFADAASVKRLNIRSAMCVPLYYEGRIGGIIYVDTQSQSRPFRQEHLEVLTALALFSAVAVEQARLRENILHEQKIRERLARYSSPGVVEQIVASSDSLSEQMMADEKEVSVLFADLSGFTSLSENMGPSDVVGLLNVIFDHLTDAVFQYSGTLDKFIGDGLLAFFGAPLSQPDHAEVAVRAALEMQDRIRQYNELLETTQPVAIRIGINSGPVVVGDIGSPNRRDYTVIGDVVNVASRLESSIARPGQIIIGPATYDQVKSTFRCEPLGPQELKGKKRIVEAYLVLPEEPLLGETRVS